MVLVTAWNRAPHDPNNVERELERKLRNRCTNIGSTSKHTLVIAVDYEYDLITYFRLALNKVGI